MIIHIRDNALDRRWKNQNHTLKGRITSKVLAKNEIIFLSFFYAHLKWIYVCHSQDFSQVGTHFSDVTIGSTLIVTILQQTGKRRTNCSAI